MHTDSCIETLNLVRHITVPEHHALMGIHPILSVVCGTDDGFSVIEMLRSLSSQGKKDLSTVVEYCVHSSIYPHSRTVWPFNEPQSELLLLRNYLSHDTKDLEDAITVHSETYPFIAIDSHYTDPPIVKSTVRGSGGVAGLDGVGGECELSDFRHEHGNQAAPSMFVPALALGSLYILSKYTKEG